MSIPLLVCKPRVLKLSTQFKCKKSTPESNFQLDMTNSDVNMTSYLNFATNENPRNWLF